MSRFARNSPFACCFLSTGAVGVWTSLHGHPSRRCRTSSNCPTALPRTSCSCPTHFFPPICHRAPGGIAPSATAETRSSSTPLSSSCISCTRRQTWTWSVSPPPPHHPHPAAHHIIQLSFSQISHFESLILSRPLQGWAWFWRRRSSLTLAATKRPRYGRQTTSKFRR